MADPLASRMAELNEEVEEFESFVNNFATQMDDIISGKHQKDEDIKDEHIATTKIEIEPGQELKISPAAENSHKKEVIRKTTGKIDYTVWDKLEDEPSPPSSPKPIKQISPPKVTPKPQTPLKNKCMDIFQGNIKKITEEAKAAFNRNDLLNALALYSNAIEFCKAPPSEWIPVHEENDRFAFIDKILTPKSIPIEPLYYVNRALVYFKLQQYEKSIIDCKNAIEIDYNCIKAHYRQSQCYKMLQKYTETITTLNTCIELLEKDPLNHKFVSETVIKEQLSEIKLLKADQDIANEEKQGLLKDPTTQLLETLLISFTTGLKNIETKNEKAQNELESLSNGLVALLESHSSLKHAFRLLDGYEKLVHPNIKCDFYWCRVILATIKNNHENCRFLSLRMDTLLEILCPRGNESFLSAEDQSKVFSDFVKMFLDDACLLKSFSKQRSTNKNIGEMIKGCFLISESESCKMVFLTWINLQVKSSLTNFKSWDISVKFIAELAVKELIKCKNSDYEFLYIDILFMYSLQDPLFNAKTVYEQSDLIASVSVWLKNELHKGKNKTFIMSTLGFLHNSVLLFNRSFGPVIEKSMLVDSLIEAMGMKVYSVSSLKVLAKLVKHDSHCVTVRLHLLNWSDCSKILKGPISSTTKDEIQNWVQLLVLFLKKDDCLQEFYHNDGCHVLIELLRKCFNAPGQEIIIGNLALALSICSNDEMIRDKMVEAGLMELCVTVLRKMDCRFHGTQKNLGMLCAKLCHNCKGLEIAREMKAIELLYSLGSYIYDY